MASPGVCPQVFLSVLCPPSGGKHDGARACVRGESDYPWSPMSGVFSRSVPAALLSASTSSLKRWFDCMRSFLSISSISLALALCLPVALCVLLLPCPGVHGVGLGRWVRGSPCICGDYPGGGPVWWVRSVVHLCLHGRRRLGVEWDGGVFGVPLVRCL